MGLKNHEKKDKKKSHPLYALMLCFLYVLFFTIPLVSATTFTDIIAEWGLFSRNVTIGSGDNTIIMNGTTGNISTVGNITANTYYGDGSQLTGISSGFSNGSNIWVNNMGVGIEPAYPIHALKQTSGNPIMYFDINGTGGLGSAVNFNLLVPSHATDTGTLGILGFFNNLNNGKDRTGATLVEGVRNNFDTSGVVQTKGSATYKGVYNIYNSVQHTGGTITYYGEHSTMPNALILSGNPTYNIYGNKLDSGSTILDIASGTINRYGLYLQGWACTAFDNNCYGIYDNGGNWKTLGSIQGNDYYSGDGTQGMTGTCTIASITSITVKDGLITGCT